MLRYLFILILGAVPLAAASQSLPSSAGPLVVQPMVTNLERPWAIGFLPGGKVLITEREGELLLFDGTSAKRVKGVPRVADKGQGGLLDILVPRDFAQSKEIIFTFAKRQGRGAGTALAVGRLDTDRRLLSDVKVLFEAAPSSDDGRHFGSRVREARDGTLYVTIGDRGQRETAQDLKLQQGSVIRVNRDGTIPSDNPFVNEIGARPEIWSYGHRNPQGLAMDLKGNVWAVEHGAKGGDEINAIRKGANYGWPIIAYGTHYSGAKIGEGTQKTGMEQPEFFWDPSIAPSGMMIYSGKLWPQWRGNVFVGSLKFDYIARLDGAPLKEREQIKGPETERVRDIREAPDGSIWFISIGTGTIYRLVPEQ